MAKNLTLEMIYILIQAEIDEYEKLKGGLILKNVFGGYYYDARIDALQKLLINIKSMYDVQ